MEDKEKKESLKEKIKLRITEEDLEALRRSVELIVGLADKQEEAETFLKLKELIAEKLKEEYGIKKNPIDMVDDGCADEEQKALDEAFEAAKIISKRNESKEQTRLATAKAKENLTITGLWKGNRLFSPTSDVFIDAFAPHRIYYQDDKGERVSANKDNLHQISETSQYLFALLTSLRAGKEKNIYEELIKNPSQPVTFSVTQLAKHMNLDPRSKGKERISDKNLMIQRGQRIFDMLEPLSHFVGELNNGSLYKVLTIQYYDADTDSITITAPYIGMFLRSLQNEYISRQQSIDGKRENGKRISKKDAKPFEKNDLLKASCQSIDNATYEIMLCISNFMVRKGAGKKQMKLKYSTIIEHCPSFQNRLAEIEGENTTAKTKARDRNNEYRKFAFAWKYLLDPKYSAMSEEWINISCTPTDKKGNLKAPTNTTIDDQITIFWSTEKG